MSTLVALSARQRRITGEPGAGDVGGVAVNEVIFAPGVTRTRAVAVIEPVAFVAVSTYVVVTCGETGDEPLSGTEPSVVIETDVAFSVDQVRVDEAPWR